MARARMLDALRRYEILGIRHNIAFLRALVAHPDVVQGKAYTRFIEDRFDELTAEPAPDVRDAALAIAAFLSSSQTDPSAATRADAVRDPWDVVGPLNW
jgi:acetyl-CoA/propionyl-CoA carboxylase biotin carboxyl carrier protein